MKKRITLILCSALLATASGCGTAALQSENISMSDDAAGEESISTGISEATDEQKTTEEKENGSDADAELSAAGEWDETQARALSAEEIAVFNENLDYTDNGFFVCAYYRPEEIDWGQVLYNGAGIAEDLTDEQYREIEEQEGEIYTDVTAVREADLERFVREKTGTEYAAARKPIYPGWSLLGDDLYYFFHGDTNAQQITFTSGEVCGDLYRLHYIVSDWWDGDGDREYIMTARITDGSWMYLSNLPAEVAVPLTLVTIDYYQTEEEAVAQGAEETAEVAEISTDQPENWYWAVLTAQQDDVIVVIDRAYQNDDYLSSYLLTQGIFVPGENQYSKVFKKGEKIAVRVNVSMTPTIRAAAYCGSYYGDYRFGEELHQNRAEEGTQPLSGYIAGHDLESEGKSSAYRSTQELERFLSGGWVSQDEDGMPTACVEFTDFREMRITTNDATYTLGIDSFENLYREEDQGPDLMCLSVYDDATSEALPEYISEDSAGDYSIDTVQLYGEQILTLTQANNGDGALSWLMQGTDENNCTFELHRYIGTAEEENQ